MVNRSYFEIDDPKFTKIKEETLKFVDIFEKYFITNVKCVYKFEDFMATLATHLTRRGYSMKKVEKWFIRINNHIQEQAEEILNKSQKEDKNEVQKEAGSNRRSTINI